MIEMDHKITVVGNDCIVKRNPANPAPVVEAEALRHAGTATRTLVRRLNVENQLTPGRGIPSVKDLRHDFITKIQVTPFDSRLVRRNREAHIVWASRELAVRLIELSDLIQLPLRRLAINDLKHDSGNKQDWGSPTAPPRMNVWRAAQFRIIYVDCVFAGDVLLREEARGSQRLLMVGISSGI